MVSALVVGTNTYATNAFADTYLGDSIRAAAWEGLEEDQQNQSLISAARLLEKQCWLGTRTVESQPMKWPRTGVIDAEGIAQDPLLMPLDLQRGQVELAFELSQDPTLEQSLTTGTNISRVKAGSAEVDFFRPGGPFGTAGATRFPTVVQEYIGQFLCGFRAGLRALAFGTDAESQFDDDDFSNIENVGS